MVVSRIGTHRVSRLIQRRSVPASPPVAGTFTRSSVAYDPYTGAATPTGLPRFAIPTPTDAAIGLLAEEATTNLLTANQSSVETNTTGFATGGTAVITRVNTWSFNGTWSLKVDTASDITTNRLVISGASLTNALAYVASAWVYNPGAVTITVAIVISGYSGANVAIPAGQVRRLTSSITATSTASTSILMFESTGQTFHIDGLQLEQKAYATSWTLGGTTRNAETFTIPSAGILTVGSGLMLSRFYVGGDMAGATQVANHILLDTGGAAANRLLLTAQGGTPSSYRAIIYDTGGTTYTVSHNQQLSVGWHIAGIGWDGTNVYLYLDGVQYSNAATMPASVGTSVFVGCDVGNGHQLNQPTGWIAVFKTFPGAAAATAYTNPTDPATPSRLAATADYFLDFASLASANGGNLSPFGRPLSMTERLHIYD